MEPEQVAGIVKSLTKAQRERLLAVCRTNGGGVRVRCRVNSDGDVVPVDGAWAKLFTKGLIQGKSGSYETVVHTRDGLAVRSALKENDRGE